MITFKQSGDFKKVTSYLERLKECVKIGDLNKFGEQGVAALSAATPVDTGETASSWYYEIKNQNGKATISFCNSNIENGVPIAESIGSANSLEKKFADKGFSSDYLLVNMAQKRALIQAIKELLV